MKRKSGVTFVLIIILIVLGIAAFTFIKMNEKPAEPEPAFEPYVPLSTQKPEPTPTPEPTPEVVSEQEYVYYQSSTPAEPQQSTAPDNVQQTQPDIGIDPSSIITYKIDTDIGIMQADAKINEVIKSIGNDVSSGNVGNVVQDFVGGVGGFVKDIADAVIPGR